MARTENAVIRRADRIVYPARKSGDLSSAQSELVQADAVSTTFGTGQRAVAAVPDLTDTVTRASTCPSPKPRSRPRALPADTNLGNINLRTRS